MSYYPTGCLLLDTLHCDNHCIILCGKWVFDSNFEVTFPLTQDFFNYIYRGNDTNEIKFIGVLCAIRAFHSKVVQRIVNIK